MALPKKFKTASYRNKPGKMDGGKLQFEIEPQPAERHFNKNGNLILHFLIISPAPETA